VEIFRDYKKSIAAHIEAYLSEWERNSGLVNRWGADTANRLRDFIKGGKMLRGGFVLLAARMYGADVEKVLPIAAAMEFFQSAFLIHDDIMDRDTLRRGKKSLYFQYEEMARNEYVGEAKRAGQSLGICLGDLAFFQGFELLSRVECAPNIRQSLTALASKEYAKVVLAQMEDVYFGLLQEEPDEQKILGVYRHKTARYTFSLPLMLGAIFAGTEDRQLKILSELGEQMGLIFQIKDDEIGLFGDNSEIGKPVGSDIMEDKKTLFRLYLMRESSEEERAALKKIFGHSRIDNKKIAFVRDMMRQKTVLTHVQKLLEKLHNGSRELIEKLEITEEGRKRLENLLDYSIKRTF